MKRFLFALLFFPAAAFAGEITLAGEYDLRAVEHDGASKISGKYTLVNRGNDRALQTFPVVQALGTEWAGEGRVLKPGESSDWSFEFLLSSTSADGLPAKGLIPVIITRHYQDLNRRSHSAADAALLLSSGIGEEEAAKLRAPQLSSHLTLVSFGEDFEGSVDYRNLTGQPIQVRARVVTSHELTFEPLPQQMTIPANGTIRLPISGKNFQANYGSTLPVIVVSEWQDGNYRRASLAFSALQVFRASDQHLFASIALATALIAALLTILIWRRKRHGRRHQG